MDMQYVQQDADGTLMGVLEDGRRFPVPTEEKRIRRYVLVHEWIDGVPTSCQKGDCLVCGKGR